MPIGWQPYPASAIRADGPLGATNVQEALDLLAAAGPFYTTEQFASYALGPNGGAFTTLKTFTISSSTTRKLIAYVNFTGGNAATPTSALIKVEATARRTGGGTTSVASPTSSITNIGFSALNVAWTLSGASVALQFRASGAPTVRATLLYAWLEQLPP